MRFTTDHLYQVLSGWPVPCRYRVALSGGLDSTVLLQAVAALQDRLAAPVVAVHVDHGLQAGSADWATHCQTLCDSLGIPLETHTLQLTIPAGQSTEAVARDARYNAFAASLLPGELLLTAQHQDDQAETVLLQLLRGAGVAGLAAMPALSPLAAGMLGRPLLGVDRSALEAYAQAQALTWVEDPSNAVTDFDRNYLRQQVMPAIKARWPAAAQTISRSATHCAAADQALKGVAADDLAPCQLSAYQLAIYPLMQLPAARRSNLLRVWIAQANLPMPPTHKLAQLWEEVIHAKADASPRLTWPGAELRRYRDTLWLMPSQTQPDPQWTSAWSGEHPLALPADLGELHAIHAAKGIDPARWQQGKKTVTLRTEGLSCTPAGRQGTRPLKKLFQDFDVPPWLRERIPLLFIDGQLAAVGDLCVCEPFAAKGSGVQLQWQRAPWLQLDDPEAADEEE